MITILIAADHKPSREALTQLLSLQPGFKVMGVCADTHAAISIAAKEQPHIVLIDGSSDPLAAIAATRKIVACSTAGVIALSRLTDSGFAKHILGAGALGYLSIVYSCASEIITAINEVAKDNVYLCKSLTEETNTTTVQTPERFSSIKKSIESFKESSRKKFMQPAITHWHSILQWTN